MALFTAVVTSTPAGVALTVFGGHPCLCLSRLVEQVLASLLADGLGLVQRRDHRSTLSKSRLCRSKEGMPGQRAPARPYGLKFQAFLPVTRGLYCLGQGTRSCRVTNALHSAFARPEMNLLIMSGASDSQHWARLVGPRQLSATRIWQARWGEWSKSPTVPRTLQDPPNWTFKCSRNSRNPIVEAHSPASSTAPSQPGRSAS